MQLRVRKIPLSVAERAGYAAPWLHRKNCRKITKKHPNRVLFLFARLPSDLRSGRGEKFSEG